jgi:biopolymer transport protein ExbD
MRLRRSKRALGWEVNIAPMIDIVFQLIIYGLVTSLITKVEVENIALPEAKQGEEKQAAAVGRLTVNVCKDGSIVVGGQGHTIESLRRFLSDTVARQGPEDIVILIRGDREADWKPLAQVMAACAANGIGHVRVAVLGPEEAAAAAADAASAEGT